MLAGAADPAEQSHRHGVRDRHLDGQHRLGLVLGLQAFNDGNGCVHLGFEGPISSQEEQRASMRRWISASTKADDTVPNACAASAIQPSASLHGT